MNKSLWDTQCTDDYLRGWLYGKTSLTGATRKWFVDRAAQWSQGTTLLDAGCGGGVTAYQLNEVGLLHSVQYTGVDGSERMIKLAKEKTPDVTWCRQDLGTLNLGKSFDKVLLRAVLAHVHDPKPIITSVCNHLKTNGELFIIFWNNSVDQATPIETKVSGGFWDIGHPRKLLQSEITKNNMVITEQHKIDEKSARENHRDIWVIKHK